MTAIKLLEQRIEGQEQFIRVERENQVKSVIAIENAQTEIAEFREALEALKKLKGDER